MRYIKIKLNKIKYYFKVLVWAKTHSEQVKNYKFLLDLKKKCHEKFIVSEREEKLDQAKKAKIQEELINNILNHIKI